MFLTRKTGISFKKSRAPSYQDFILLPRASIFPDTKNILSVGTFSSLTCTVYFRINDAALRKNSRLLIKSIRQVTKFL